MKAIGISGSPRKNGNTEIITEHILKAIEEEGHKTELVRLAGLDIRPCTACMACLKEETCSIRDDLFPIYNRMKEADAIILTTPVYCGSATGLMKSLMDRTSYISSHNGRLFEGKVGGPFVVTRRSADYFTQAQLNFWFHVQGLFIPGSLHPNIAFGRDKGDVQSDREGLGTAWKFGKNIAFLADKLTARANEEREYCVP
jgi:multimeric flavodoxin WrbA